MKTQGWTLLLCLALLCCQPARALPEPEAAVASHDPAQAPPIVLTLFLHDQLEPREIAGLGPDYLEWFIKELSQTTGRRVQLITLTRVPGLTDFGYRQGDELASLVGWQQRLNDYIKSRNLPVSSHRHKYVLVTRHNLTSDVQGLAFINREAAIASIKSYNTIAHEVGHLFGATHEDAETRFNTFPPCRTVMYAEHLALTPSCFVFSARNRQAINAAVNGKPD